MKRNSPPKPETINHEPATFLGEYVTRSPEETLALARRIGEQLKGGEIFLLEGNLGAGKTVFAKGLAAGLAIDPADVTSPSFTLVNVHEGRLRFYHVDLYRLEAGAHHDLGLDEILEEQNAVTAIEWPERLDYAPLDSISVNIIHVGDTERKIEIKPAA